MSDAMSSYAALMKIADIHYQAQSHRFPEGECAVCYRLDGRELVGERFPCPTRRAVADALDFDPAAPLDTL